MSENTFRVGKPLPYFCRACQAVPRAGYCKLAGCPTAPAESGASDRPLGAEGKETCDEPPSSPDITALVERLKAVRDGYTIPQHDDPPNSPWSVLDQAASTVQRLLEERDAKSAIADLLSEKLERRTLALEAAEQALSSFKAEAREVVEPFAKIYAETVKPFPDMDEPRAPKPDNNEAWGFNGAWMTWGQFRAAAAFLSKLNEPGSKTGEGGEP